MKKMQTAMFVEAGGGEEGGIWGTLEVDNLFIAV